MLNKIADKLGIDKGALVVLAIVCLFFAALCIFGTPMEGSILDLPVEQLPMH